MTRPVDVSERVGQWLQAYTAIKAELTPDGSRELLGLMMTTITPEGPTPGANVAMSLARLIASNDRAAATVAAMLVATGIKPVAIDYGDPGDE